MLACGGAGAAVQWRPRRRPKEAPGMRSDEERRTKPLDATAQRKASRRSTFGAVAQATTSSGPSPAVCWYIYEQAAGDGLSSVCRAWTRVLCVLFCLVYIPSKMRQRVITNPRVGSENTFLRAPLPGYSASFVKVYIPVQTTISLIPTLHMLVYIPACPASLGFR
jgi:hypothetical protein